LQPLLLSLMLLTSATPLSFLAEAATARGKSELFGDLSIAETHQIFNGITLQEFLLALSILQA
jgi:hypothetical protein